MNPENIDLESLSLRIAQSLDQNHRFGYVAGKTMIRNWMVDEEKCSEEEAEALVDTLCSLGWLRFSGEPTVVGASGCWLARGEQS